MCCEVKDVVLSVKNVSKCFEMYEKPIHRLCQTLCAGHKKFYKEFWALKDISFDVRRGECVGIIGRNGAGKSTLLQIITGTLAPTSGTVETHGRIAALLELGSGFNPEFTGKENVYLNGSILGLSKEEINKRYDDILAFADIGEFIDQPVKTYSSGMMVRLAFAVQIMVDPDILIVDEALAVGDAAFQRKCYARLEAIIDKGTTLFLVTHDISAVRRLCTQAVYLEHGGIKIHGNTKTVTTLYMQDLFPEDSDALSVDEELQTSKGQDVLTHSVASQDYIVWRKNKTSNSTSYGSGYGSVDEVRLYGFQPGNIMPSFGKVKVEIHVSWNPEKVMEQAYKEQLQPNIYYGYSLASQNNIQLFGANTYTLGCRINPTSCSSHTCTFEVEWPQLQEGVYFLSAAISLGSPHASTQLKWTDYAIQLNCDKEVRGGMFYPRTRIIR